jgi:hypothetical protein
MLREHPLDLPMMSSSKQRFVQKILGRCLYMLIAAIVLSGL